MKIGVFEEGPAVRLCDENGHTRIWLGMSFLDQPQIIFYDKITTQMRLGLDSGGEPALAMLDTMTAHAAKSLWKHWDEQERQREEREQARKTRTAPPAKKPAEKKAAQARKAGM